MIAIAVRWYLRYGLSYRDVEELLAERGVTVDHVTVYRWVQRFTPEFIEAARPCRHAPGDRWFAAIQRSAASRHHYQQQVPGTCFCCLGARLSAAIMRPLPRRSWWRPLQILPEFRHCDRKRTIFVAFPATKMPLLPGKCRNSPVGDIDERVSGSGRVVLSLAIALGVADCVFVGVVLGVARPDRAAAWAGRPFPRRRVPLPPELRLGA